MNLWRNGGETFQTEGRACVKILRKKQAIWRRPRIAVSLKWRGEGEMGDTHRGQGRGLRSTEGSVDFAVVCCQMALEYCEQLALDAVWGWDSLEEKGWKQRKNSWEVIAIVQMSDASNLDPGWQEVIGWKMYLKGKYLNCIHKIIIQIQSSPLRFGSISLFKWMIQRAKLGSSPMPCEAMFSISNLPLISPPRWTDPITLVIQTVLCRVCPSRHLSEGPDFLPCSLKSNVVKLFVSWHVVLSMKI